MTKRATKTLTVALIFLICFMTSFTPAASASEEKTKTEAPQRGNASDSTTMSSGEDISSAQIERTGQAWPVYLSRNEIFPIEPPASGDSAQTASEITTLKFYANNERTPEQVALIKAEDQNFRVLIDQAGLFDQGQNQALEKLLSNAGQDMAAAIVKLRKEFSRPQPNMIEKNLTTAAKGSSRGSYPGSHAAQSRLVALIMEKIDPSESDQYENWAYGVSLRREIAGLNYPSDTKAGTMLAEDMMERLMAVPQFQQDLKEAADSYIRPREKKIARASKSAPVKAQETETPAQETQKAETPETSQPAENEPQQDKSGVLTIDEFSIQD